MSNITHLDQVRMDDHIWSKVKRSVWMRKREQFDNQVCRQVGEHIMDNVWRQVSIRVGERIRDYSCEEFNT